MEVPTTKPAPQIVYSSENTYVPLSKISDDVNHPSHYQTNGMEVIDYIESLGWGREFCLGNVIKYISRSGKKDPDKEIQDLEKAGWYLDRCIKYLKSKVAEQ